MTELFDLLMNDFIVTKRPECKAKTIFPVDVYEDKDSYRIDAYLPGYTKSAINLNTENGILTITVKKKEKGENLIFSDIGVTGDLKRSFLLESDVNEESVTASLKNGVLTVTLLKLEAKKLKDIKIK